MTAPLHGDCASWCQTCQDEEDRARVSAQRADFDKATASLLADSIRYRIAQAAREARAEALEEAAQVAERWHLELEELDAPGLAYTREGMAAEIRALKGSP